MTTNDNKDDINTNKSLSGLPLIGSELTKLLKALKLDDSVAQSPLAQSAAIVTIVLLLLSISQTFMGHRSISGFAGITIISVLLVYVVNLINSALRGRTPLLNKLFAWCMFAFTIIIFSSAVGVYICGHPRRLCVEFGRLHWVDDALCDNVNPLLAAVGVAKPISTVSKPNPYVEFDELVANTKASNTVSDFPTKKLDISGKKGVMVSASRPTTAAASANIPSPAPALPTKYSGATSSFVSNGNEWLEIRQDGSVLTHFKQDRVAEGYVYIYDRSRPENSDPDRPLYVRLPLSGGMAEWSYPNPFVWKQLALVTPEP